MITIELQDYELDLNKIKPKNVRKSDKYDKRIYQYLKNNPEYRRVWFATENQDRVDDDVDAQKFDINNLNLGKLYFGNPNSLSGITGHCIRGIVASGKNSQLSFLYIDSSRRTKYIEVTKEFFEKYIEIGRCVYGHKQTIDVDTRYTYIDNKNRICNWCGKKEKLIEESHTRINQRWIEA